MAWFLNKSGLAFKAAVWWIFRAYRLAALVLGTIILLSGANVFYLYLTNQLPPPQ